MTSPEFTAIIVGGSVAGLTLAHAFDRARINYLLLEARDIIAPQLGAGIVLQPNGARILDQLGVLEGMKGIMTPLTTHYRRRGDDGSVIAESEWPRLVTERLGYPLGATERTRLLRILYEQLGNKSKVMLRKRVVRLSHERDCVRIFCADGTDYKGAVVVGADGIHSSVRAEMQRLGKEANADFMNKDEFGVTAEYQCIFGLSRSIPSLTPGDNHVASDTDHSSIIFVSKEKGPQWFFFSKMDNTYQGSSIPRFTKAQMDTQVESFGDFNLTGDVTLKQLVETSTSMNFFPLEEGVFEHWFYGRAVCVGDSIHKMTPNAGQGGNQAIESAAVLTNCLVEMLSQNEKPSFPEIETAFKKYQDLRKRRASQIVKIAGLVSRDEALATLHHTLQFLYIPQPSAEFSTNLMVELYKRAPYLDFLPLPKKLEGNKYWNARFQKEKEVAIKKARL